MGQGCRHQFRGVLRISARHERRRQNCEHAKGRNVPEQRADERNSGNIKRRVDDSSGEPGNRSPPGQRIMYACRLGDENRGSKERKRLHVILEVAGDAPGKGLERRHPGVARACSPSEAVLCVCSLRGGNQLKEAPHACGRQHHQLKTHMYPLVPFPAPATASLLLRGGGKVWRDGVLTSTAATFNDARYSLSCNGAGPVGGSTGASETRRYADMITRWAGCSTNRNINAAAVRQMAVATRNAGMSDS